MFVYTIQPVLNRLDNRLNRVNGASVLQQVTQLTADHRVSVLRILTSSVSEYSKRSNLFEITDMYIRIFGIWKKLQFEQKQLRKRKHQTTRQKRAL